MSACFRVTVSTTEPVALPWSNEGVDQPRGRFRRRLVVSAPDRDAARKVASEIGKEMAGGRNVTVEYETYLHWNDHVPIIRRVRDAAGRFAAA